MKLIILNANDIQCSFRGEYSISLEQLSHYDFICIDNNNDTYSVIKDKSYMFAGLRIKKEQLKKFVAEHFIELL